jgi:hypothetical protein
MRGDANRQKKLKKPKSNQTSTSTSATKSVDMVSSGTTHSADMKKSDTVQELVAGQETTSTTKPPGTVKFENIQVNVSNEESKLCYDQETSGKQQAVAALETDVKSSSSTNNLAESNSPIDRKKTPSESSSSNDVMPNLNQDQNEEATLNTSFVSESNEAKSVDEKELSTTPVNEQQQPPEPTMASEQDEQLAKQLQDSEYVNPRGVRFVQDSGYSVNAANLPYGLPCVRELLRFLISLISNRNSEMMVSMGLNLITIGLESGIDHIASYQTLLAYIKDDLCKNLYDLLSIERLSIYTNVLRVTFLLFESLRANLKLQLEHFLVKLMEIILSESNRVSQEQKEITIDFLVQMLRIPGFAIELYLNYDCSYNSSNIFEDLTKLLSKVSLFFFVVDGNAFCQKAFFKK